MLLWSLGITGTNKQINNMDKATLKSYFQTGKIPTQSNFEALIDYIPENGGGKSF